MEGHILFIKCIELKELYYQVLSEAESNLRATFMELLLGLLELILLTLHCSGIALILLIYQSLSEWKANMAQLMVMVKQ